MGRPVVFRPWTRRRERPRSSRDHNLNPIDVPCRFSTSMGPSDIQQPPLSPAAHSASPGIIIWGRDPHFEGHYSMAGLWAAVIPPLPPDPARKNAKKKRLHRRPNNKKIETGSLFLENLHNWKSPGGTFGPAGGHSWTARGVLGTDVNESVWDGEGVEIEAKCVCVCSWKESPRALFFRLFVNDRHLQLIAAEVMH